MCQDWLLTTHIKRESTKVLLKLYFQVNLIIHACLDDSGVLHFIELSAARSPCQNDTLVSKLIMNFYVIRAQMSKSVKAYCMYTLFKINNNIQIALCYD